jgi:hypothetical protein
VMVMVMSGVMVMVMSGVMDASATLCVSGRPIEDWFLDEVCYSNLFLVVWDVRYRVILDLFWSIPSIDRHRITFVCLNCSCVAERDVHALVHAQVPARNILLRFMARVCDD